MDHVFEVLLGSEAVRFAGFLTVALSVSYVLVMLIIPRSVRSRTSESEAVYAVGTHDALNRRVLTALAAVPNAASLALSISIVRRPDTFKKVIELETDTVEFQDGAYVGSFCFVGSIDEKGETIVENKLNIDISYNVDKYGLRYFHECVTQDTQKLRVSEYANSTWRGREVTTRHWVNIDAQLLGRFRSLSSDAQYGIRFYRSNGKGDFAIAIPAAMCLAWAAALGVARSK